MMLSLLVSELRILKYILFLIFTILLLVLSVLSSLVSLAVQGMPQIDAIFDNHRPNGVFLNFTEVKLSDYPNLSQFGIKEMRFALSRESEVKSFVHFDDMYVNPNNFTFFLFSDEMSDNVTAGHDWNYSDNFINDDGYYHIWISDSFARENDYTIGDYINVSINNDTVRLSILGTIENHLEYDMLLPFDLGIYIASNNNISTNSIGSGILPRITEYNDFLNRCNQWGIGVIGGSGIEDILRSVFVVKIIVYSLVILLILCVSSITYHLFKMVVRMREKFMAICDTLGIASKTLFLHHLLIMESILILAIVLSYVTSGFINNSLASHLTILFEQTIYLEPTLLVGLLTFFAVTALFLFRAILSLKKLKKTPIISFIEERA